jgi:hypothetical protein
MCKRRLILKLLNNWNKIFKRLFFPLLPYRASSPKGRGTILLDLILKKQHKILINFLNLIYTTMPFLKGEQGEFFAE